MNDFAEIRIRREVELSKIIAFMRVGAQRVQFRIPNELVDAFLKRIEEWAAQNRAIVSVRALTPDGDRLLVFGIAGALVGGAVGGAVAGVPGVAIGAAVGAGAAALLARYRIEVQFEGEGGAGVVSFGGAV